jgi:uncharacterized protein
VDDGLSRPALWAWSLWRLLLFVILFLALSIALGATVSAVRTDAGEIGGMLLYSALLLAAAWIAGVVLLRACDRRAPAALGFGWTEKTPAEIGLGLGLGAAVLALAVVGMLTAGALRYVQQDGSAQALVTVLARDFAVLAVAAAAEEALFRGYPFQVLVQWLGAAAATLLTSAAFAFAHVGNPNVGWFALANIFLAGIVLSAAYLKTYSLWFATGVHLGWNWAMTSLFDLPVSGITLFDTPLYDARIGGPAWLTGEAFGPEGGLLGTLALGAAAVVLLRWKRLAPAAASRAARPLIMDTRGER